MDETAGVNSEAALAASLELQDDGYFGPESVSWRVFAAPASGLAGAAAALLQMLLPQVVYVIDQASSVYKNPALRGELTGLYYLTLTYGDKRMADNAGASLWTIHSMKHAIDPTTRRKITATDPELLLWVHNTVVWCQLRALERYGPVLTPAEQETFLQEQYKTAEISRVDTRALPRTVAELNAYVESMMPRLRLTPEAERIRDLLVPIHSELSLHSMVTHVMTHAAVDLLTPQQQTLYEFHFNELQRGEYHMLANLIFSLTASKLPPVEQYAKIRAALELKPFGNKQVLLNSEIPHANRPTVPTGSRLSGQTE